MNDQELKIKMTHEQILEYLNECIKMHTFRKDNLGDINDQQIAGESMVLAYNNVKLALFGEDID
jgi:hypothetical protein